MFYCQAILWKIKYEKINYKNGNECSLKKKKKKEKGKEQMKRKKHVCNSDTVEMEPNGPLLDICTLSIFELTTWTPFGWVPQGSILEYFLYLILLWGKLFAENSRLTM